MDDRQLRAWQALGLGPVWQWKARPQAQVTAADPWVPLRTQVERCEACALARTRTRTVFGSGSPQAQWVFVGEAPGAEEDRQGEPFVGPAGQLLDQMLAAIGVDRDRHAFVANVLKCRPPANRDPAPGEIERCAPFLARQIELLPVKVMVALGRFAAQTLLRTDASLGRLRSRVHRYAVAGRELPLIVTFHPAYLLRNPADKALAWADLCLARSLFDSETLTDAQTSSGPH